MRNFLATKVGATYAAKVGGGTIAGTWEGDVLVDGTVAFVEADGATEGTLIPAGGLANTPEHVKVYVGRVAGRGPIFSNSINRETLEYHKKTSVVHLHGIFFLGSDTTGADGYGRLYMPASIAIGDVFGFQIIDLSKEHYDNTRYHNYSYTAVSGDTADTIINALVAQVNADPDRIVTALKHVDATPVVNGIKFTEIYENVQAQVSPTDLLKNADIIYAGSDVAGHTDAIINGVYYSGTTTVTLNALGVAKGWTPSATTPARPFVKSEGTRAQLTDYEAYASTELGNANINHARGTYYSEPTMLDATTVDPTANDTNGWTVYTLTWTNVDAGMPMQPGATYKQKLVFAVPTADAALIIIVDDILASL